MFPQTPLIKQVTYPVNTPLQWTPMFLQGNMEDAGYQQKWGQEWNRNQIKMTAQGIIALQTELTP